MMTDENKQLLEDELAPQEGTATDLSPALLTLEKHRITCDRKLEPMDFLFQLFGRPCFPRKELVGITGKAKSGKTFLVSMLMTCCVVRDVLSFHRQGDQPLRLLWYDTEQSDESTQDILRNRIMTLIKTTTDLTDKKLTTDCADDADSLTTNCTNYTNSEPQKDAVEGDKKNSSNSCNSWSEKSIDVFNVRAVEWKQRRALLTEAVRRCKPDVVMVDGIRDLVNDINDGVLAQEVMEELLHLATQAECCIVCVLHQNKSGEDRNLRGWIGTELMNKAFEVYSCEKLMPQRIFAVEQTLTRKYDIERTMYFKVGDDGLPVVTTSPDTSQGGERQQKEHLPPLNPDYIVKSSDDKKGWHFDVEHIVRDAMNGELRVQAKILRERVMSLTNIQNPNAYNTILHEAMDRKLIEQTQEGRLTFYEPAPF